MRPFERRASRRNRPWWKRTLLAGLLAGAGLGWALLWPDNGLTHVTTTNTVVFEREIVGILRRHCVDCHAPKRLATPLVRYEEVWLAREAVLSSVLSRRMPPWAAVAGYGDFSNDNALTSREKQFLVSWVEGLGPRNAGEVFLNVAEPAGQSAAATPDSVEEDWELGEPALVLRLPQVAPAADPIGNGESRLDRVVLDLALAADRELAGLEFRPAGRESVRAASFFLERSGRWLGSWTPWHPGARLPPSVAHRLRAGDRLVSKVLYEPGGEEIVELGSVGLFFRDDPAVAAAPAVEILLETTGGTPVPGGLTRIHAEVELDEPLRVLSFLPSVERGVRSVEVSARLPGGKTEILLLAQDIPLEWPTPYLLDEIVLLERGSTLRATAYYETPDAASPHLRVIVSGF